MQKYYANMISWFSFVITITATILMVFDIISVNYVCYAVIVAAILDMFDGKVARKYLTEKEDFIFGEITDSLCDTINFGIVPIIIFINIYEKNILFILIIISLFYLWAVVYRLARFSKTKTDLKVSYYQGLPVTVAASLLVLLLLMFKNSFIVGNIIMIVLALLMISKIKVKKI